MLHVYDWGDDDGMPYLVLEYLGGGSLRSLLDAGRLLSPQQAATIGAEAANGLAYAHRRGLVHRDIKPANLLFDDDGRLLVADFGLARALAEAALTEPLGTVMGTARYASPEQVEGRPVDDRTDVYSLALTLYESVTGRVPFAGDTTVATLMARVGAVLPPARELGPLAPVLAQAAISEPLAASRRSRARVRARDAAPGARAARAATAQPARSRAARHRRADSTGTRPSASGSRRPPPAVASAAALRPDQAVTAPAAPTPVTVPGNGSGRPTPGASRDPARSPARGANADGSRRRAPDHPGTGSSGGAEPPQDPAQAPVVALAPRRRAARGSPPAAVFLARGRLHHRPWWCGTPVSRSSSGCRRPPGGGGTVARAGSSPSSPAGSLEGSTARAVPPEK